MELKKLVAGIMALLLAFIFIFVAPDFGQTEMIISLVATLFGFWGVADWRKQYDKALLFFESKTIVGALLVAVPMIALSLIVFFGWHLPGYLIEVLKYLVQAGGGWMILGASHALAKHEAR